MTCSYSSNIALLGSKSIDLSFLDQKLSNGVFISTVRPSQQKLGTRLTKLTVFSRFSREAELERKRGFQTNGIKEKRCVVVKTGVKTVRLCFASKSSDPRET